MAVLFITKCINLATKDHPEILKAPVPPLWDGGVRRPKGVPIRRLKNRKA